MSKKVFLEKTKSVLTLESEDTAYEFEMSPEDGEEQYELPVELSELTDSLDYLANATGSLDSIETGLESNIANGGTDQITMEGYMLALQVVNKGLPDALKVTTPTLENYDAPSDRYRICKLTLEQVRELRGNVIRHRRDLTLESFSGLLNGIKKIFSRKTTVKSKEKKPVIPQNYYRELKNVIEQITKTYANPKWLEGQEFTTEAVEGTDIANALTINGRQILKPTEAIAEINKVLNSIKAFATAYQPHVTQFSDKMQALEDESGNKISKIGQGKALRELIDNIKKLKSPVDALPGSAFPLHGFSGTSIRKGPSNNYQGSRLIGDTTAPRTKPPETIQPLNEKEVLELAKEILQILITIKEGKYQVWGGFLDWDYSETAIWDNRSGEFEDLIQELGNIGYYQSAPDNELIYPLWDVHDSLLTACVAIHHWIDRSIK